MYGKRQPPEEARAQMVKKQLARRRIEDQRVLEAMAEIPRHRFVDERWWHSAYQDRPLPIGHGQTISQPYIVAFMSQALQLPEDQTGVVLEIGTGSGYQAAVLSRLARRVYSVERIEPLAERARAVMDELEIENVSIKVYDGGYGWPEHAPYDGILVAAGAPEIPAPLLDQLKDGGRLIVPVGPQGRQILLRIERQGEEFIREELAPVAFVPLLGEHGWQEPEE